MEKRGVRGGGGGAVREGAVGGKRVGLSRGEGGTGLRSGDDGGGVVAEEGAGWEGGGWRWGVGDGEGASGVHDGGERGEEEE